MISQFMGMSPTLGSADGMKPAWDSSLSLSLSLCCSSACVLALSLSLSLSLSQKNKFQNKQINKKLFQKVNPAYQSRLSQKLPPPWSLPCFNRKKSSPSDPLPHFIWSSVDCFLWMFTFPVTLSASISLAAPESWPDTDLASMNKGGQSPEKEDSVGAEEEKRIWTSVLDLRLAEEVHAEEGADEPCWSQSQRWD